MMPSGRAPEHVGPVFGGLPSGVSRILKRIESVRFVLYLVIRLRFVP